MYVFLWKENYIIDYYFICICLSLKRKLYWLLFYFCMSFSEKKIIFWLLCYFCMSFSEEKNYFHYCFIFVCLFNIKIKSASFWKYVTGFLHFKKWDFFSMTYLLTISSIFHTDTVYSKVITTRFLGNYYFNPAWCAFKEIVSQDWLELEMISMDKSEVFSIAGSYFYFFKTMFSCLNL